MSKVSESMRVVVLVAVASFISIAQKEILKVVNRKFDNVKK